MNNVGNVFASLENLPPGMLPHPVKKPEEIEVAAKVLSKPSQETAQAPAIAPKQFTFHGKVPESFTGKAEVIYEDRHYWGELKNGKRDGEGFEVLNSGTTYQGAWRGDKKNGYGSLVSADWTVFKGHFVNGKAAYGEMYMHDATTYIGNIANGTFNGYGKLFENTNGKVLQEGHFVNGKLVTPYTDPNGPKFTMKL